MGLHLRSMELPVDGDTGYHVLTVQQLVAGLDGGEFHGAAADRSRGDYLANWSGARISIPV
jgi:hypothetical protein